MNRERSPAIRIAVDTSSNVPAAWLARHAMIEVATSVLFGDDEYRLGRDLDRAGFYRLLATRPEHPTTSQPSPQQFQEAYAQAFAEGAGHVLCVVVSAKLSGTFNSAALAAQDFPPDRITVWDSRGVSITSGLQAIAAGRLCQEGCALADVLARLATLRDRVAGFLTVENLDALARSGRVSALQKGMGNMLNLKPVLAAQQGLVVPVAKARGRQKAKAEILRRLHATFGQAPVFLAASHANVPEEAQAFLQAARERLRVADSLVTEMDPAIAALAGAGTLGLAGYPLEEDAAP